MAKSKAPKSRAPEGYQEVSGRVAGFFVVVEGNAIQGILRDSFIHVSPKYGPKKVYKIEVTRGDLETQISDKGETRTAEVGETVGVDEKGWLKKLERISEGTGVYVECMGQETEKEKKKGQNAAWKFNVLAAPKDREPGSDDDDETPIS